MEGAFVTQQKADAAYRHSDGWDAYNAGLEYEKEKKEMSSNVADYSRETATWVKDSIEAAGQAVYDAGASGVNKVKELSGNVAHHAHHDTGPQKTTADVDGTGEKPMISGISGADSGYLTFCEGK